MTSHYVFAPPYAHPANCTCMQVTGGGGGGRISAPAYAHHVCHHPRLQEAWPCAFSSRLFPALWALLLLVVAALAGRQAVGATCIEDDYRNLSNVTAVIKDLLTNYDIRLRPKFGGQPLEVGLDVRIASFDSISEVNMDYTITMYLLQHWQDHRLAFSPNQSEKHLTLSGDFAEKIWVPDTFFANDKNSFLHDVTEKNKMVRLSGNGNVIYGMRFTATLACMMNLRKYPLDIQNCTVEIESYGYTTSEVTMSWKNGKGAVKGVDDLEIPQFTIVEYKTVETREELVTGTYQRLSLSFKMKRNIGYFVFQTYLPSILIVMLSWVSFWINHEATSARVALGITTVLTMTTISTGVRSSLPRISYVKAIDIYLVMCFVFVFAALLEYAAVNYTYWGARAKKKKKKMDGEEFKTSETVFMNEISMPEVEEVRMSPIPSLRNRQNTRLYDDAAMRNVTPNFRMTSPGHRYGYPTKTHVYGRKSRLGAQQRRSRVLQNLRKRASQLKDRMPKIQDVNIIDKYSRLVFPIAFILFNTIYWCYYIKF